MIWNFKKNAEPQGNSDGFWYGINEGYIKPENVLEESEQIETLKHSLEILNSFERALEFADLLNEF